MWQSAIMPANWPLTCLFARRTGCSAVAAASVRESRGTFHFFRLDGLTWIDWATVAGLILTVVGFGITWWQLQRTRTAQEALSETLALVNEGKASDLFTASVPALRNLYARVVKAAEKNDSSQLAQLLVDWAITCSGAIEQLERLKERKPRRKRHLQNDILAEATALKF
jgi:hypothetical protein